MNDRDSLFEIFDIVYDICKKNNFPLTASALPYIKGNFGMGYDVYFRRRLSVVRMLNDLHIGVSNDMLDVLLSTSLCHHLPVDNIPFDYDETMRELFKSDPRISEILRILFQNNYDDKSYYGRLIKNPYALIIRLTERGVLVETLYEWPSHDARSFIKQTMESFFPMCIYGKEHYPQYIATFNILMEKTRNLVLANETLIDRYEALENSMNMEILNLREENAALRTMIKDQLF